MAPPPLEIETEIGVVGARQSDGGGAGGAQRGTVGEMDARTEGQGVDTADHIKMTTNGSR